VEKFHATDAVGIATDGRPGLPVVTMPWYYEVDRQQRGPVSEDEFAGLVQTGVVRAETLVWKDGWPDWRPYATVSAGGAAAPAQAVAGAFGLGASGETAVCAVSGKTMLKREMLEFEGRWVGAEHKAEFFQRLREGVALPQEVVYATVGRRWLAMRQASLRPPQARGFIMPWSAAALPLRRRRRRWLRAVGAIWPWRASCSCAIIKPYSASCAKCRMPITKTMIGASGSCPCATI
jgi:hypothetical protein